MNQGLFESLTGAFMDGSPVESISAQNRRILSIMDHLNRMFNTRQGSIPHLIGYGLPDITDIYRKMPDGIDELKSAIKHCVEKYEPRLRRVSVVRLETDAKDFKLVFILSGEMVKGGMVRFQTTFTSSGRSSIAPWKKAR